MTPDVEAELQALRGEIARVRGRASLLTMGLVAALIVGVAAVALGWPKPGAPYVTARGFLLKDGNGRTRGALGVASNGTVSLALTDDQGSARAALSVDGAGSGSVAVRTGDGASAVLGSQQLGRTGAYPGERRIEWRNAASIVLADPAHQVFWAAP